MITPMDKARDDFQEAVTYGDTDLMKTIIECGLEVDFIKLAREQVSKTDFDLNALKIILFCEEMGVDFQKTKMTDEPDSHMLIVDASSKIGHLDLNTIDFPILDIPFSITEPVKLSMIVNATIKFGQFARSRQTEDETEAEIKAKAQLQEDFNNSLGSKSLTEIQAIIDKGFEPDFYEILNKLFWNENQYTGRAIKVIKLALNNGYNPLDSVGNKSLIETLMIGISEMPTNENFSFLSQTIENKNLDINENIFQDNFILSGIFKRWEMCDFLIKEGIKTDQIPAYNLNLYSVNKENIEGVKYLANLGIYPEKSSESTDDTYLKILEALCISVIENIDCKIPYDVIKKSELKVSPDTANFFNDKNYMNVPGLYFMSTILTDKVKLEKCIAEIPDFLTILEKAQGASMLKLFSRTIDDILRTYEVEVPETVVSEPIEIAHNVCEVSDHSTIDTSVAMGQLPDDSSTIN